MRENLNRQRSGYSSVRLEYTSGGRGVAGSNPVIPTAQKAQNLFLCLFFVFCKPRSIERFSRKVVGWRFEENNNHYKQTLMVCGSRNKYFAPVPTGDAPPRKNAPKKIGSDIPLAYYECELTNRQLPQFDCKGTVLLQSNRI